MAKVAVPQVDLRHTRQRLNTIACPRDVSAYPNRDAAMESYQWFLLGMMVAWTPGLLVLALLLWRHHVDQNSADVPDQ